jgi:hypothetical protein
MASHDGMRGLDREQQALCLGARTTLLPGAAQRLAALAREGLDWERLWGLGHLHEVVPLLAETLPAAAPDDVPAEWLARVLRRRHGTLATNAKLAEILIEIVRGMGAAGVDVMPVKGLVLAETLYGSLAARPCADLDVLVRPADMEAARSVFRSLGFVQPRRPVYTALVHEFHDPGWGRGTPDDHVRVELHWALWAASEQRLGTVGLWERSVAATLLDEPIRILSPEDTLLHLSIHRTRSALRLRWVADIAELLRRYGESLDWDAYLSRARAAGARTSSWVVLGLARDLLEAPVPDRVLRELAVKWPKRAVVQRIAGRSALFRPAPAGNVKQQPHLALRAFEEDGVGRIAAVLGGSAVRPLRKALHNSGLVKVRRRTI